MNISESDSITVLRGVGPKKAEAFEKLNIRTVGDMLTYYPRTYEDRRTVTPAAEAEDGDTVLIRGRILSSRLLRISRGRSMLIVTGEDGSGRFESLFFNAPYLAKNIQTGAEYDMYGKVKLEKGTVKLLHPSATRSEDAPRGIIPVYPLTKGITNNEIIRLQRLLREYALRLPDPLSGEIRKRNNICGLSYALSNIHFPEDRQKLRESRYRLVFDEFLAMQLGLGLMKNSSYMEAGGIKFSPSVDEGEYIDSLDFQLTNAQRRVIREIVDDMESPTVMNRLLQGDVGSGKTVVAETALYKAVRSGYQGVLMAPTEVLARQHFRDLRRHFERFGIKVLFLSSSLKKSERDEMLSDLASGRGDILVGTHAVIQPDVKFADLGLVITDEQHRFGVRQRSLLTKKGLRPDRLVMTATPIPRTLTVTAFGDMQVSKIDELPAGRKPVETRSFNEASRRGAYDILREELKKGHQGYVVTPLIDEAYMEARSVSEVFEELRNSFRGYEIAMLHGEMKSAEKDDIMGRFAAGEIDVLVSTVVIEVGINVPNATVMLVENAERFGLAQLHQLRGRVGRGSAASFCLLITCSNSDRARERAEILCDTGDGFVIAEKDLELRGPGEIFGVRQHGELDLKIGDMFKHYKVMEKAMEEAKRILSGDPGLSDEANSLLRQRVTNLFGEDVILDL